ncbi:beta-ketoacyl-[acyl-carrier-protein] synthase family protein [Bacillus cereus]|nr:beta-ketoacyl-[acyl-carrier-protein] synthase family protein [Bacillus cereus]
MNKSRVVVTGIGVVASNGQHREEFFRTIINGDSGLKESTLLEKMRIGSTSIAGEVATSFIDNKFLDEEKSLAMGYQAINEAILDSGLEKSEFKSGGMRCGLSISTSIAGQSNKVKHIESKLQNLESDPRWLIEFPDFSREIARFCGISGPTYTTVSACAAGTAGAGIAIDQIRDGKVDFMIVVGMDMLAGISAAGFHSLESMSAKGCTPFDKNRDGTSLGEGAAVFIVETLDHAMSRNAHIYGELLGYGLSNDAYHITSPDPEGDGAIRAMTMALEDAGLQPQDIDYINVHGTATQLNDVMESRAISKLLNNEGEKVLISSTKAVTGHCLGAAGSIELAVILMAVDRNVAPLTANLSEVPEQFNELNLVKGESVNKEIKYAMSNSFAFSGNAASILVGKVEGGLK